MDVDRYRNSGESVVWNKHILLSYREVLGRNFQGFPYPKAKKLEVGNACVAVEVYFCSEVVRAWVCNTYVGDPIGIHGDVNFQQIIVYAYRYTLGKTST